jgi:putative toxin-antitoxin system antitoxin component (TIGR02293 family)
MIATLRPIFYPASPSGFHWRKFVAFSSACRGESKIESMPKVRKGARSRRPARIGAAVPNLPPRQESKSAALKANPEELTKVVARATEVFGDQDVAFRWLGTPVGALDYATPISFLATHQGAMRVNDVLTQIEHGVW